MIWIEIVLRWFAFAKQLAALATEETAESPEFYVTFRDGRQFEMAFRATRKS